MKYWSDSHSTGIAVTIGEMLLDPPKLGTPLTAKTVLGTVDGPLPRPRKWTWEERRMRRQSANAERTRKHRLEAAVFKDFDRLQKADELEASSGR